LTLSPIIDDSSKDLSFSALMDRFCDKGIVFIWIIWINMGMVRLNVDYRRLWWDNLC